MKKLLPAAFVLLLSAGAKAQLMFKNTKSDTFQVAVVTRQEMNGIQSWVSKGWFKLLPGDSASVEKLTGPSVYYFLHTIDNRTSTGGTKAFLVDKKEPFNIRNADIRATEKSNPNFIWRDFHEVRVPEKALADAKLMIVL